MFPILRQKGTEPPFKNLFWDFDGTDYRYAGCDTPLFESSAKFESSTGRLPFGGAIVGGVEEKEEVQFRRVVFEVCCALFGSHSGHLFGDDRSSTGRSYIINSAALKFGGEDEGVKN